MRVYNHKKPIGDPTCPACVCNAKRILERIKEVMDVSDGDGAGGGAVGAVDGHIPPMERLVGDAVGNEDGEDG